ncbi:hypothetical protein ACFZB6_17795 [Streptomyces syringium]|uniref:hypothetical protein n=1 Tax=Streptomyces syringium TaxID=76729 RepID=UPI0036EAB2A7
MPPQSAMNPIPSATPPAHRALVHVLRDLRLRIDAPLERIAKELNSSSTTLSKWLGAKTLPKDPAIVLDFRTLAITKAGAQGHFEVPSSDELRWLLEQAHAEAKTLCVNCRSATSSHPAQPMGHGASKAAVAHAAKHERHKYAESSLHPRKPAPTHLVKPSRRPSFRHQKLRLSLVSGQGVAPVPPQLGDRRCHEAAEVGWPGLHEVAVHFDRGRAHDGVSLVQHLVPTMTVQELSVAVAACRSIGLGDAADTMLKAAARRDSRAVLHIVSMLNQERRHTDIDVLLRAAEHASA